MADAKISALTNHGTPVGADYVASVLASGPSSRKLLMSDLRSFTGMALASASPTTADIAPAVNTLTVADLSGLTAARNFVLPATAAVNDLVGVVVSVTHATPGRELILKADTGDGILASGTTYTAAEWTRVWIVGELVVFRCIVANTTWVVDCDGRIPSSAGIYRATNQTSVSAATIVKVLCSTVDFNSFGLADATNSRITTRRGGTYSIAGKVQGSDPQILVRWITLLYVDGAQVGSGECDSAAGTFPTPNAVRNQALTAGQQVELYVYFSGAVAKDVVGSAGKESQINLFEVL